MIICVPAPALPHLRPALRLACPTRPVISLQGRRTARAAPRGCRAAPGTSRGPAGLGRPRSSCHADPAPASKAADAPARHPRHRPALAPVGAENLIRPDGSCRGRFCRVPVSERSQACLQLPGRTSPDPCAPSQVRTSRISPFGPDTTRSQGRPPERHAGHVLSRLFQRHARRDTCNPAVTLGRRQPPLP